jgi:hypothetical protein
MMRNSGFTAARNGPTRRAATITVISPQVRERSAASGEGDDPAGISRTASTTVSARSWMTDQMVV